MIALRLLPAAALLMVASAAGAKPSDPVAGRVAGKPERCIALLQNRGGTIVDQDTIIYEGSRGRRWKTGPVDACPGLRANSTLIVEVYGSQLCRNDRFRTIEPGLSIPSATCRFRDFVPYTLPKTRR